MSNVVVLKLLVTILDRGKGKKAVELYQSRNLHFHFACLGHGTANSSILDYLGLGETQKDVVLTLVPAPLVQTLLEEAAQQLQLCHPGRGIVFAMPLSGVSGAVCRLIQPQTETQQEGWEKGMEHQSDLILAVVNQGGTEPVMEAARAAGARGGTVLHARRVGYEDLEQNLGLTVEPEKEIVAILTARPSKQAIMEAVSRAAGISTEHRGILFSVPVDDIVGLPLF